jgi:hypothetical protein
MLITFCCCRSTDSYLKQNKMRKLTILAAILLSNVSLLLAQAPDIQWQKNYGGTGSDRATSVRQTPDGGYIVAGYTNSDNGDVTGHKSGDDYWVMKLDANGSIVFKKIYGGNNDDRCYDVRTTADGGYILAGTSNSTDGDISSPKGGFDAWIVKLNAAGDIEFETSLGGSDDESAASIIQLPDGGYVMAGESKSDQVGTSDNFGGYDVYVARLTSTGAITFQKLYGGSATDRARGIARLSGGEYIVVGETDSNDGNVSGNKGGFDYYVLRLRTNGLIRFTRTIGGTDNDHGYGVVATSNNGYAVTGETFSNNGDVPDNSGGADFFVMSIRGNGTTGFAKTFGGETADNGRSISRRADGSFILSGEAESSGGDLTENKGGDDFWVLRVSAQGNILWQKSLGGADNDNGMMAVPTADGGVVVVGESESDDGDLNDNNGNDDYWIVKLKGQQFERMMDDATGNSLFLYPNPASDYAIIEGVTEGDEVTVLNTAGMVVYSTKTGGDHHTLNVSSFPEGSYFIRVLKSDGTTQTLPLIRMK